MFCMLKVRRKTQKGKTGPRLAAGHDAAAPPLDAAAWVVAAGREAAAWLPGAAAWLRAGHLL